MDLRQLRYFVAVADELHFRRASAKLHVAQPALSEQIRKLEAELGVPLMIRSSRSVTLTDAGAVLLADARRILHQAEVAAHATRVTGKASGGRLRLGLTPFGPPSAVRASLSGLCAAPPRARVRVELETGDARSLLLDVRSGHLDAAVVHLPAPTAGLRVIEVGREVASAVTVRHGRRPPGPVTLKDLVGEPLLVLRRRLDPAFHDAVLSAFVHHELLVPVVHSTAPTIDQLLLEVAAGAGAALVPHGVAERMSTPGLDFRPVDDGCPSPPTGFVTRDEQPGRALATMLAHVTRAVEVARRPALALVGDEPPVGA
jgi:DNA-binding transcriptional LysR family regulator